MTCAEVQLAFWAAVDGELSAENSQALAQHLQSCAGCRGAVRQAASAHRALLESSIVPGKKRIPWAVLGSVAACLVVAVGIYFFARGGPAPLVEVVRAEGEAYVLGRAAKTRATPGLKVFPGEGIETAGPKSAAAARFSDGTRLELKSDTKISLDQVVFLERGTLGVTAERPMVFGTPQAEAKILGTKLTISASRDATRVEVSEGKVRVTRKEDGASVDVAPEQYALVSRGTPLAARPLMAPNSWQAVPNSKLRSVIPEPARYPKIQGHVGPACIVSSWSGGALDTRRSRLLVWGGGSTQYRGNELYAFSVETMRWERLTDPTPDPADGKEANPDGTPNARATYNGLAYIAHADQFFAHGGDLGSTVMRGAKAGVTWTFDCGARRWSAPNVSGPTPVSGHGHACSYDPISKKIFWAGGSFGPSYGLFSYDPDAGRWTRHNVDSLYYFTSTLDTRRGLLVLVGNGKVLAYDVRNGNYTQQVWKTTGGDGFIAGSNPGLDYDPKRDRIVGWRGGGVYALDPESKVWTAYPAAGAPKPTPNGIFGRWRYVPSVDAFVVVTDIDENVYFYKLPD